MTLVDTSVWINHLRRGDNQLRALLERGEVLCHPFIIGELACGSMANRTEVLELLRALPKTIVAEHYEVMHLLHKRRLYGRAWVGSIYIFSRRPFSARLSFGRQITH